MAELISPGLRFPNLRNRFRVRFVDAKTQIDLPESEALSSQLVSLSNTSQLRSVNSKDRFPIYALFEDDVTNVACKALQSLMRKGGEESDTFNIVLEQLDGVDTLLRTMTYVRASIYSIDFPSYTYGQAWGPDFKLNLRSPRLDKRDLEELKEVNPLLYSVYQLVNNTTVEVTTPDSDSHVGSTCQFQVNFEYSHLETRYSN